MPLVRIDLLRGRPERELTAISSCVHEAMVADLSVPERDRFQIITEHEPGRLLFDRHYLDVDRGDGWVLVHVTLAAGRSTEAKQAFYAGLSGPPDPGISPVGPAPTTITSGGRSRRHGVSPR